MRTERRAGGGRRPRDRRLGLLRIMGRDNVNAM